NRSLVLKTRLKAISFSCSGCCPSLGVLELLRQLSYRQCCRVGGECIVGFLACTSICVSQSFFPLFRLAFSNANGYKFKRVHQELATLEMLRENFGIQVNEATFKGIEL
ncbi:hypothetical protein HID58_041598, partial [Brassica napus]